MTDDTSHSTMLIPLLKICYVAQDDYRENTFVIRLYLLNGMLDNFTLTIVSQGDNYEELHFMQD
jgi:hypothetical protein